MRIKFSRINFETECLYDIINGKGFLISEMPFNDADKTIANMDGPRSPRFGTAYDNSTELIEKSRCSCGRIVGAMFEGDICEYCGTKVEYKDVDILYTGWLNFAPMKLINPLWFHKLQSALSKKVLENIISNENIITSNGIIRTKDDIMEVKKSQLLYHNIGLNN